MRWRELPEGVPPTNEKQGFAAPDTATPGYLNAGLDDRSHRRVHEKHEVYERVEEEDDEEGEEDFEQEQIHHHHHNEGPNVIHVMIAIGLLLLALAAIVYSNNRNPVPLCSSQPDWNQYNCRPG